VASPIAEVAIAKRDATSREAREKLVVLVLTQVDWLLWGGVVALVTFGLWALAGITRYDITGDPTYYLRHQELYTAVGVAGAVAAIVLGPEFVRRRWRELYALLVAGLLLILVTGRSVNGATRWISIGSFQFQPSEFGKPILAIVVAGFLASRGRRLREPRSTLDVLALASIPIVLVFLQPDLGTALVYGALLAGVVFIAGTSWKQIVALIATLVALSVAVIWVIPDLTGHAILKPYQKARLVHFWAPSRDASGPTYNVQQSKIAVASGGVRGRGESGATQTRFKFVPAHQTDFAFAAFAEQHGFAGAAALMLIYLLVIWRGLRVVTLAQDAFSAMLVAGVLCMLLFQIAINVGMTMQIAPVTGIPLPFVSYGGSATIANLGALGLLLAVQIRVGRRRRA